MCIFLGNNEIYHIIKYTVSCFQRVTTPRQQTAATHGNPMEDSSHHRSCTSTFYAFFDNLKAFTTFLNTIYLINS